MSPDDQHVDDETLTLLALGEDAAGPDDRAHVAACPRCADEVASLALVADTARTTSPLVDPPPRVWDAVADELSLADRSRPGEGAVLAPVPRAAVGPHRRRRAWAWIAAAAAAGVVVGGVGTWFAVRGPSLEVVASAVLEPLPGWDALGEATVETASDGRRVLVVDLDDDVPGDGFREVWLLRPDASGLVSVGTLDGTSGRFDLPAGLDLAEFPVVDVSQERFDGDPAHSGDSIVRGTLGT